MSARRAFLQRNASMQGHTELPLRCRAAHRSHRLVPATRCWQPVVAMVALEQGTQVLFSLAQWASRKRVSSAASRSCGGGQGTGWLWAAALRRCGKGNQRSSPPPAAQVALPQLRAHLVSLRDLAGGWQALPAAGQALAHAGAERVWVDLRRRQAGPNSNPHSQQHPAGHAHQMPLRTGTATRCMQRGWPAAAGGSEWARRRRRGCLAALQRTAGDRARLSRHSGFAWAAVQAQGRAAFVAGHGHGMSPRCCGGAPGRQQAV